MLLPAYNAARPPYAGYTKFAGYLDCDSVIFASFFCGLGRGRMIVGADPLRNLDLIFSPPEFPEAGSDS
jgi:hypothetical protein